MGRDVVRMEPNKALGGSEDGWARAGVMAGGRA